MTVRDIQPQDVVARQTIDGARQSIDEHTEQLNRIYHKPTPRKRADYNAKWGELVRVDPVGGPVKVFLPRGDRDYVGRHIVIENDSASSNVITIQAAAGELIDGVSARELKSPYRGSRCVLVEPGRWITTIPNYNTGDEPEASPTETDYIAGWARPSWELVTNLQGTAPSARSWPQMCYMPSQDITVLFSGYTGDEYDVGNETWQLYNGIWQQVGPVWSPEGRYGGSLDYGPFSVDGTDYVGLIMFAGQMENQVSPHLESRYDNNVFYSLTGSDWAGFPIVSSKPLARGYHGSALDYHNKRLFVYGGFNGAGGPTFYDDFWKLDLATGAWTEIASNATGGSSRSHCFMCYDPLRRRVYFGGGWTNNFHTTQGTDMWEYDPESNSLTNITPPPENWPSRAVNIQMADTKMVWVGAFGRAVLIAYEPGTVGAPGRMQLWAYNAYDNRFEVVPCQPVWNEEAGEEATNRAMAFVSCGWAYDEKYRYLYRWGGNPHWTIGADDRLWRCIV